MSTGNVVEVENIISHDNDNTFENEISGRESAFLQSAVCRINHLPIDSMAWSVSVSMLSYIDTASTVNRRYLIVVHRVA